LLSATLIVRNEEQVLRACLSSLDAIASEIIVVDTGSTDKTAEIARTYGVKLYRLPWADDFSAARNFAIDQATQPWILYIDADERVRPIGRESLAAALAPTDLVAARVRFYPRTGFTAYREYRLFRRDARIRFEGVVHETMVPAIQRIVACGTDRIADCDLKIDHIGYDGPQTHKTARYLPLLSDAVRRAPERVYLWWHMGCVRRDLGHSKEAESCWRHGAALAHARGRLNVDDCLCHIELIKLELGRRGDAAALISEARALRPDNCLVQWLEGKFLMRCGRLNEAGQVFAALSRIDPETLVSDNAYDKRLFGAGAADLAGECAFRAGDFAQAVRWFGVAEEASGGALEYRSKRRLAESKRRASAGAWN
jgi:glycosyltransferase involved in cell wall biosynthesis